MGAASFVALLSPHMSTSITLDLPELLYARLANAAQAMQRPLEEVLVRALRVGSPPGWDDAPAEMQAELAAFDRLDDEALYRIARERGSAAEVSRYDELLERQQAGSSTAEERAELSGLR